MKTFNLSAILAVIAVSGTAALAQNTPAVPSPAAPSVIAAPIPINGFVYVEKLPTPTQLTAEAEAEHLVITRMDQSADRMLVVYQYPNGSTRTFAYTTSAPVSDGPAPAMPPPTATYTLVAPPPATQTVVYSQPAPVVYYESPSYVRYYDPAWDFWAPLAIGVGLGWGFHGGHGGYGSHGGWHGGGYHGHGGWHH